MSSREPIDSRTCEVCGKLYPAHFAARACEKSKPPEIRVFKPADRLRLNADVFARRFSGKPNEWPADQNVFCVVGDPFDRHGKPTAHCAIRFDQERGAHRYEVCVRWLGRIGDIKANRRVWVWADELDIDPELTPLPQAIRREDH